MSDLNGLYKMSYATPNQLGHGVIVFNDGRAQGGDSIMAYNGTYRTDGSDVHCDIVISRHSESSRVQPALGIDRFRLNIVGKAIERGRIAGAGTSPDVPDHQIKVMLTRLDR